MTIDFCGPLIPADDGGVSYRIEVDGRTIACRVSMEALQDIDPRTNRNNPIAQFKANSQRLLSIAEKKIRSDDIENNIVWIYTGDL